MAASNATLDQTMNWGLCSHVSRGINCSDFVDRKSPNVKRYRAAYTDARGVRRTLTLCTHHAVKFAARHSLMRRLYTGEQKCA